MQRYTQAKQNGTMNKRKMHAQQKEVISTAFDMLNKTMKRNAKHTSHT